MSPVCRDRTPGATGSGPVLADAAVPEAYDGWRRTPIAGDASSRRYDRLTGPDGRTAILMTYPPGSTAEQAAFRTISEHLRGIGLVAPAILAPGPGPDQSVIDDLGRTDVAAHLSVRPADETTIYDAAVDVLAVLAKAPPPPGLVSLSPRRAAEMVAPFFDWFLDGGPTDRRVPVTAALEDALARHASPPTILSLRDFHAQNMIWRPDATGTDRIGLLDFQDAMLAPPEYDLASLTTDARRDVGGEVTSRAVERFARATGRRAGDVAASTAILGVQRNLRILGIFARLAKRDGKVGYLDLVPRVRRHVHNGLRHPAAAGLRPLLSDLVGAP